MSNKEQRKAPVLRFKGFTDDWEQRKWKDILLVNSGKDYKHLSRGSIPVYGTGGYMLSVDKELSNVDAIGIGRKGTIDHPQYLKAPFWTVDTLFFMTPKNDINIDFAFGLSQTINWKKYDESTGLPSLSKKSIDNISIKLPNYNEQIKIGRIISQIDNVISLQQRKLEYYRKLKKRLSNKVFSTENYGATVTLGKIFNTVTDYVANGSFKSLRENVKTYSNKNYAYLIRLQDASNNWQGPWLYTDKKGYDFLKKSKLRPGDIIMANVGSVGKVFQVPDLSYPMTLAPNAILLRSKAANNAFLFEFLRSDYGQNLVRKMTTPGVQNKINKTDFKKITIRLPKKEIQDKWASLFESLNQIELGQLSSISNLKEIKKFLLQNMFI